MSEEMLAAQQGGPVTSDPEVVLNQRGRNRQRKQNDEPLTLLTFDEVVHKLGLEEDILNDLIEQDLIKSCGFRKSPEGNLPCYALQDIEQAISQGREDSPRPSLQTLVGGMQGTDLVDEEGGEFDEVLEGDGETAFENGDEVESFDDEDRPALKDLTRKLLALKECADELGRSVATLNLWKSQGLLTPRGRKGRAFLYDLEEVREVMEQRGGRAPGTPPSPWKSLKECADLLGRSYGTLNIWKRQGLFNPKDRVGRSDLYDLEEIRSICDERPERQRNDNPHADYFAQDDGSHEDHEGGPSRMRSRPMLKSFSPMKKTSEDNNVMAVHANRIANHLKGIEGLLERLVDVLEKQTPSSSDHSEDDA